MLANLRRRVGDRDDAEKEKKKTQPASENSTRGEWNRVCLFLGFHRLLQRPLEMSDARLLLPGLSESAVLSEFHVEQNASDRDGQ